MTAPEARIVAAIDEIRQRLSEIEDELQSPYLFASHRDDLQATRAALVAVRELLD